MDLDTGLSLALRRAAVRATFAPSVHNTQPWRFRLTATSLEIHADWTRRLRVFDPLGRQLLISCGCAIFNARVALAVARYEVAVERFPDPEQLNLVARLRPLETGVDDLPIAALEPAIPLRHNNRRPFADEPTPDEVVAALIDAAESEGAQLFSILRPDHRRAAARLSRQADDLESLDIGRRVDLGAWTSRQSLLLLGTERDSPAAWLRAGEALERVLLEITRLGYVASPLTHVIEVAATNALLRAELELTMHPHLLLRIGRAPATPASRRRRLVDMLEDAR